MAVLIGRYVGGASNHVNIHESVRDGVLQCRSCEGSLVAKRGRQRAHHFAHASGQSCDPWRKRSKMVEWQKCWL